MKKGISLLNQRQNVSDALIDFLSLELLPESFGIFVKSFELSYDMINFSKVLINQRKEFFVKLSMFEDYPINGEKYNATIDQIFDIPELIFEYNQFIELKEYWHKMGFMKVGLLFHGDVLLLGLENSNKGQIWRYGAGLLNTQCCKLDDSIFEFISRLKEEVDSDQLDYLKFDLDQLYKNWNEDFWRIETGVIPF